MKRTTITIAIASICIPVSSFAADPRCAMGLFVLCQQGPITPVTNQAGSRPATTTTAPTQVGGIVPDIHNSVLVSTSSQPTLNQISPAHTPTTPSFQLTPQEIAWAQAHFGQGANTGGSIPPQPPKPVVVQTQPPVSTSSLPTLGQLFPAHTPTTPSFQLTPQEIAWAQAHFGQGANTGGSIPAQPPKPVVVQTQPPVSTSSLPTLGQLFPAHTPTTPSFQLTPQEIAWAQANFGQGANPGGSIPQPPKPLAVQTQPVQGPQPITQTPTQTQVGPHFVDGPLMQQQTIQPTLMQPQVPVVQAQPPKPVAMQAQPVVVPQPPAQPPQIKPIIVMAQPQVPTATYNPPQPLATVQSTITHQIQPLAQPPQPPVQGQPPAQQVAVPPGQPPKPVVVTAQPQVPTSTYNPPQPLATVQPTITHQVQPLAQPALPTGQGQPPAQQVAVPPGQPPKPVVVTAQPQVPTSTYNPPQPLATVQPTITHQVQPLAQPPLPTGQGQPPAQQVAVPPGQPAKPIVVTAQPQLPTSTYNPPQPLATVQPTITHQVQPLAQPPQPPVQGQPPAQQVAVPPGQPAKPVVVTAQPQMPTSTYNPPQPLATVQPTVSNQVQPLAQLPQPSVQLLGQGQPLTTSPQYPIQPQVQPQPYRPYALLTHAPQAVRPVTSGRFDGSVSMYNLEFIEPGLQHRKVKVYRTNDAAEQIYKDMIPLDKGGFQIIVIGTRNPDYVH